MNRWIIRNQGEEGFHYRKWHGCNEAQHLYKTRYKAECIWGRKPVQVPECPEDTGQSSVGSGVSLEGIKSGGVCAGDIERSGKGGVCSCRAFNLLSKSFSSAHIQHDRYFFYDRFLTAFNPQRTTSSLKCPVMRASAIGPLMPLLCRITYLVSCGRTAFQASLC